MQSTIAARIDHLLASNIIVNTQEGQQLTQFAVNPQTVFELISSLGTMALSEPSEDDTNWPKWLWDDVTADGLKRALDAQTTPLRLEFEALSFMLMNYQRSQGAAVVLEFYKYRYSAVLTWLDALGMLKEHYQVEEFFKPKERRSHMKPEAKGCSTS